MYRRLEDMTRPHRPTSNLGGGGRGLDRGSTEDGLMLGKVQYRCLGCNQPAPVMHGSIEKVGSEQLITTSPYICFCSGSFVQLLTDLCYILCR